MWKILTLLKEDPSHNVDISDDKMAGGNMES